MTVRFIHSGDWHLGKSFGTLPDGLSGELRAARFDAISRIADIAIDRAASHVLVAGDVFDSPDIARVDLRRAVERMADHPNIVWVLLPGNHDPARSGGVWQRLRRLEPPPNLVIADDAAPLDLAPGVTLLPAPLTSKFPGHDPSAWMTGAVTPPGTLRIGLAHGSVHAFGQGSNGDGGNDGDSGVTLAADRAAQSGLAYLALGDWHGTKRITPNTWYSGTPEPDRFPDNDPGHVLAVSVNGPGHADVETIDSRAFTWAKASATITSADDLAAIDQTIAAMSKTPRALLLNLALAGNVSMAEHERVGAWCERWSARLKWLDVTFDRLAIRPTTSDLDQLAGSPALITVAKRLVAITDDASADGETRAAASLALIRLFGFAAEAAGEPTP